MALSITEEAFGEVFNDDENRKNLIFTREEIGH